MNLQDIDASASPEVQMNENFETLDWAAVFGKDQPTTTGLTWGYYGGVWSGFTITAGTVSLTNATTNYVVVARATGAVSTSTATTNWNNTTDYARLYKLTTAGSVVTVVEDHRAGPYGVFAAAQAYVDTTGVGNVGAGEDTLITFSMPADTFNADKQGVRIVAWGTAANNANAKTLKLYFGSVILTTSLTTNQASTWRITAEVIRTANNAQDYSAQLLQAGTTTIVDIEGGTLTENDGAAITIKCTGDATSNDDIRQEGMVITYF